MKIFSLIYILFFSVAGFCASITMVKDSEIYCGNNPNRPNEIYFVKPTTAPGSSTSTDSAIDVYIPIYNSGYFSTQTSNGDYSTYSYLDSSNNLISTIPIIGDVNQTQSFVRHYLNIDAPNKSYLYAGLVRLNSNNEKEVWILSDKGDGANAYYLSYFENINTSNYRVDFELNNLCLDTYVSNFNPCLNLEFDSDRATSLTNTIYFFTSQNGEYTPSTPVLLKDIPNGIFFDYILSNIVPVSFPSISTVAKGDARIKINYTGNGIQNIKDIIGVKYGSAPTEPTENPVYSEVLEAGGVVASTDNGTAPSGSVVIKDLENSREIWVRIAYLNKWGFASYFSNDGSQTPEMIQTFLQEKECYLLSAGFQHDHYILEYFRKFRDKILIKNSLGRAFVQWYYDTAPAYANYIYDSAYLRNMVKGLAYIAYYILRFFPFFLFIILFLIIFFTYKKFSPIRK